MASKDFNVRTSGSNRFSILHRSEIQMAFKPAGSFHKMSLFEVLENEKKCNSSYSSIAKKFSGSRCDQLDKIQGSVDKLNQDVKQMLRIWIEANKSAL